MLDIHVLSYKWNLLKRWCREAWLTATYHQSLDRFFPPLRQYRREGMRKARVLNRPDNPVRRMANHYSRHS